MVREPYAILFQSPVSSVETSLHTIVCVICPKSTSRRYSPLFRFLAPLSSGQKRSWMKTPMLRWPIHLCTVSQLSLVRIHCLQMRNVGIAAPRILEISPPSLTVCRIVPRPVFRVGMLDVAACVLSNPLTFLRGFQSLRMFLQLYFLLNTPTVSYGLNRLNPVSFYMWIAFVFYHLLLVRTHGTADAAYAVPALVVEQAMRHSHHIVKKFPYVLLCPVDDGRYKQTLFAVYAA